MSTVLPFKNLVIHGHEPKETVTDLPCIYRPRRFLCCIGSGNSFAVFIDTVPILLAVLYQGMEVTVSHVDLLESDVETQSTDISSQGFGLEAGLSYEK